MNEELKDEIMDLVRPEIETAKRTLRIFFVLDNSDSMAGVAIGVVNQTCREMMPVIREIMKNNPGVDIEILCISFNNSAQWEIGPVAEKADDVVWHDLRASGCTAMGKAVLLLTEALSMDNMPKYGILPLCLLLSDGVNTDGSDYDKAIDSLNSELWGAKAVRLSIGIGSRYDKRALEMFCNQPEVGVLEATNAADLEKYLRFVSTQVTRGLVQNRSNPKKHKSSNVAIPAAPNETAPIENAKVVIV